MRAKNGTIYESNYARAAAFYTSTCAPVDEQDGPKKKAQELLLRIYHIIGEQPDAVGFKSVKDASFRPWEQQKGREADVKTIRLAFAKIEEWLEQFFTFCQNAGITEKGLAVDAASFTPKKTLYTVLAAVGVTAEKGSSIELSCGKECAEGLKKLVEAALEASKKADGTDDLARARFTFSRGVFDIDTDWLCMGFDDMLNANGIVVALCERLQALGYRREILLDGRYLSINYVKQYSKKPEPVKRAWADKYHLGIEISYEDLCIVPATLHLRVTQFAAFLSQAGQLPEEAKTLIQEKLKNCDACRYCVQTDKTGTRPLATVVVDGVGKCPYFPSFSLRWNAVTPELITQLETILTAYPALIGE